MSGMLDEVEVEHYPGRTVPRRLAENQVGLVPSEGYSHPAFFAKITDDAALGLFVQPFESAFREAAGPRFYIDVLDVVETLGESDCVAVMHGLTLIDGQQVVWQGDDVATAILTTVEIAHQMRQNLQEKP